MRLTTFEKPAKARAKKRGGPTYRYSIAHVRMFAELRDEGYSWGQIAEICDVPKYSARTALVSALSGVEYPEVTTTVLKFDRARAGEPMMGRSKTWTAVGYQGAGR